MHRSDIPRSALIVAMLLASVSVESWSRQFGDAIEDNSFFIEEAYNQEPSVIQHISNGTLFTTPRRTFAATFTEEWPVGGQDHQLSATIPYLFFGGPAENGWGDVLLNYRYQLADAGNWAAVAPRLSLILPTGDESRGFGSGVVGAQMNIPISKRIGDQWAVHLNAGLTLLPGVKGTDATGATVRRTLTGVNGGGSVVWLMAPNFNLMLEFVHQAYEVLDASGARSRQTETIVNPGLRFAVNLDDLQIVPGLALPMSSLNGVQRKGVLLYLSFEHPI